MKIFKALTLSAILLFTTFSQAAFITLNEAGIDSVFGIPGLQIDIRYGTATELVFPDLLDISTAAEVQTLFSQHVGSSTTVNFYFIDTISACGLAINPGIVGCGQSGGNNFVVESTFASGFFGTELLAHELGHNLGLSHLNGSNLMNPSLNSNTSLTPAQIASIFLSPLVQEDNLGSFIDITPVLIVRVATTINEVSEPETLIIMLAGIGFLLRNSRKKTINIATV